LSDPKPLDPAAIRLLDRYTQTFAENPPLAVRGLCQALAAALLPLWQDCIEGLCRRGEYRPALVVLDEALRKRPGSIELRLQLADILRRAGDLELAEQALRPLLGSPKHREAATSLAQLLQHQGKLSAATRTMAELLQRDPADADTTRFRLRFINQCRREQLAWDLCQPELARFPADLKLRELGARLGITLGRFDEAREHYLALLREGADLNELFVLMALSGTRKYRDRDDADFALFAQHLQRTDLLPFPRASILFALGKACDDIGDHAGAAAAFREGNALVHSNQNWQRGDWQREVGQRIAAAPLPAAGAGDAGMIPVFIVGLPRSGTTLVADRLGRHPQVRNRGELALVPYLEKWHGQSPDPRHPALLGKMAGFAAAHLRQDDEPARWYLDKNPLNFRSLGLIAALLPQARIIYCKRDPRDTALSIWSQFFARGEENGYAYDFADIAAYSAGCERLMAHWQATLKLPVQVVQYERMIEQPGETLAELSAFLGLPEFDLAGAAPLKDAAITTASAWQARQPVYTSSRGRWSAYAPYLPELESLFPT